MGNIGAAEVLVIFIIALIVLGPNKLPDAARQVGKAVTEIRRVSTGFQRELRDAMEDPFAEEKAREAGRKQVAESKKKTHPLAGQPPRGSTTPTPDPVVETPVAPEAETDPGDATETDADPTDA